MLNKKILIKHIMTRGVITMPVDSSVKDIAKTMADNDISAVALIGSGGGAVGIVSAIDILRVIDKDIDNMPAESIMAPCIESVKPNTTLETAAKIMCDKHIHRLVILSEKCVGASCRPVGILSSSDIVKYIADSEK